jgi:hypothetical protein
MRMVRSVRRSERSSAAPKGGLGKLLLAALIVVPLLAYGEWPAYREWRIESHGVSAPATILTVHPTGSTRNHAPIVRFRVAVRPPDASAFEGDIEVPVSAIDGPHMQKGSELRVTYLPDDHTWITPRADWRD